MKSLVDTGAEKCAVTRDHVYYPALMADGRVVLKHTDRKVWALLKHYQPGVSLRAAAAKAGVTYEKAVRMLAKKSIVEWFKHRAEQVAQMEDWARPEKWWSKGNEMMEKEDVPKHRLEIWREFGERVVPKVSRNADKEATVELKISVDTLQAAQDALERQKRIEESIQADVMVSEPLEGDSGVQEGAA